MNNTQGKHVAAQKKPGRKRMSVAKMVLLDLLAIIVGLNVFALFHHVLDFSPKTGAVVLPTAALRETVPEATPETAGTDTVQQPAAPEATAAPETTSAEQTPEPTEEPRELTWAEKFADRFTDGEVIETENAYRSANVSVSYETVEQDGVVYHIADIYLTDIRYLRSAFGSGVYKGQPQPLATMAKNNNAIVAITGDHYAARWEGVVVRNGILYREERYADVCIIGYDGVMTTMTNEELDMDAVKESGAYQIWSFGPQLLINGQAQSSFDSEVTRANPRSAIGYFEPGHYCFVQVDGRTKNSVGMTMEQLSRLFYDLGCTAAYNLDGGQTAAFAWKGSLISYPYGRNSYDAIYVADELPES